MGTQDNRYRAIGDLSTIEQSRRLMQEMIDKEKNIEERRKSGQFSTPFDLAQEIISYGLNLLTENNVAFLEPCIGSGVFYSALLSVVNDKHSIRNATGIEIDPVYYDCANILWRDSGIDLINDDFTRVEQKNKYNLLVTNPPYVRHHYIKQEEKAYLLECVKKETGIALSGLSGLYCYFILLVNHFLEI